MRNLIRAAAVILSVLLVASVASGRSAWPAGKVVFDDAEDLQAKFDAGDLGGSSPDRAWSTVTTAAELVTCAEAGGVVGCSLSGSITSTANGGAISISLPASWTDVVVQCASPTIADAIIWNPATPDSTATIFEVRLNSTIENSRFTVRDCYIQEQRGGIAAGSNVTVEGLFMKNGSTGYPRNSFNIVNTTVEVFSWGGSTVACGQNPEGNVDMSMSQSFCRGAIAYDSKLSTSGAGRKPRSFIEDSKLYAQPSHFAEGGALSSRTATGGSTTTLIDTSATCFLDLFDGGNVPQDGGGGSDGLCDDDGSTTAIAVGDIVFINYGTEFEQWAAIGSIDSATQITFATPVTNAVASGTEYRIDDDHGSAARAVKTDGNGSLDSYRNEYKHGYIDIDTDDGSRLSFRADSFDFGSEQVSTGSAMFVLNAPFINMDDVVFRGQLGSSAPVFMYFSSGGGGYFRMSAYVENCNEWWKAGGGGKLLRAHSGAAIPEFFVNIQGVAGCTLDSSLWHVDGGVEAAMATSETDGSIALPGTQFYEWIRDGVEEAAPGPFGKSHDTHTSGTNAARPATCDAGTVYAETDTLDLCACFSADTWTCSSFN